MPNGTYGGVRGGAGLPLLDFSVFYLSPPAVFVIAHVPAVTACICVVRIVWHLLCLQSDHLAKFLSFFLILCIERSKIFSFRSASIVL